MLEEHQDELFARSLIDGVFHKIHPISKDYYQLELIKYLMSHTLVIYGSEGLYAKTPMHLEPDNLIANKINQLNIEKRTYEGRSEISEVSKIILESLIDDFKQLIEPNPIGYLLMLQTFLEHNLLGAIASLTWIHGRYRNGINFSNENYQFSVIIADTFSKLFDQDETRLSYVFKAWEAYLALDKLSFEKSIEIIADTIINIETSSIDVDLIKALEFSRALGEIIKFRDDANNEIFSLQSLTINDDGKIIANRIENFDEKYLEFQNTNLHWLVNKAEDKNISSENLKRIDQVCKKYLGFNTEDIVNFATGLLDHYDSTTWIISKKSIFPRSVKEFLAKEEVEIEEFLSNLIRQPIVGNQYTDVSKSDNTPLRKSLILFYKEWFITPSAILYYSLIGRYNDVVDGNITDQSFLKELQTIYQDIDTEFEIYIADELVSKVGGKKLNDIDKIDLPGGRFIQPPGQIDILYFLEGILFIIECKNFPFKYHTQSIGNEVNKTKTKFTYKLDGKVKFVEENLSLIAGLFKEDQNAINEIKGLFVTNAFTFAQVIQGIKYPVINSTELVEWFSEKKYKI